MEGRAMEKMHYLTVQDFLWISQELTKKVQKYNFATLEEAVFSQYSLGGSRDLAGQAARLLRDFPRLKPFDKGNEACAFVGLLAFLASNHKSLRLEPGEALSWVREQMKSAGAKDAIASRLEDAHVHGTHGLASVREVTAEALANYGEAISALLAEEPAKALSAK